MKNASRFVPLTLIVFLLGLFGCGGEPPVPAPNAPPPIPAIAAVSIPEDSVMLGAGQGHQFNANVTGTSNTGVTWSLSGCTGSGCGTVTSTGYYAAPAAVPAPATVTLTATALADSTKSDTAVVYLMPVVVMITPPIAAALPGASLQLTAAVQYDVRNAGVTWALGPACAGDSCGILTNIAYNSVTYTAPTNMPDPPTIMLTATSVSDSSKKAEAPINLCTTPLKLQEGDYAFFVNGAVDQTGSDPVIVAGHFHANADYTITGGVQDVNSPVGVSQSVSFTGSYTIDPDRQGKLILALPQGTAMYRMGVGPSGRNGNLIKFDGFPGNVAVSGSGYFELQDPAAFSLSALAASYAIGMFGSMDTQPIAAAGRFTAGSDGTFTSGRMDLTMLSSVLLSSPNLALTGWFAAPSPLSGRGTASVTLAPAPQNSTGTFNFAYYMISAEKVVFVGTDVRTNRVPVLSGQMRRQSGAFSAASFNAPVIFSLSGDTWFGMTAAIGQMLPDGAGNLTGVIDQDNQSFLDAAPLLNQSFLGSYSIDPDGRSTLILQIGSSDKITQVAYLYGQNRGFLMETSRGNFGSWQVAIGSVEPQTLGPDPAASLNGTFLTSTVVERPVTGEFNQAGLTTFNGSSSVLSILYGANSGRVDFTGTYATSANGRGTLTLDTPPPKQTFVVWVVSPTEAVGMKTGFTTAPFLLKFGKW